MCKEKKCYEALRWLLCALENKDSPLLGQAAMPPRFYMEGPRSGPGSWDCIQGDTG